MKIIKSKSYIKKEAILSLPVGDPGLPGQLTERDIGNQFGDEGITSSHEGESELGNYNIFYTYDYDYVRDEPIDIKPIKAISIDGQVVTNLDYLDMLFQENKELIEKDIEILEERSKEERRPDYNPFEE